MNPFAIYFPQFYPIPTNDAAWGKGFTDWVLVANANMRQQWQPRAPMRGYYDGASSQVHRAQADEARAAGVGGFAVYHYWFFTHQELSAFERTQLDPATSAAFPWFLIWANEGWSRRWMGDAAEILHLSKAPSLDEIERHCDHLARCFNHPQYLRIDGRPLFAWYNLGHFTRPEEVVGQYKKCWAAAGIEVHTAQFIKKPFDVAYGNLVDSSYLFEPRLYFASRRSGGSRDAKRVLDVLTRTLGESFVAKLLVWADRLAPRAKTYSAADFRRYLASNERRSMIQALSGSVQDVLSPGWNNTPRYGSRFTALEALSAEAFGQTIADARLDAELPLLINAWNEWSEGAAIEPCAYFGRRYLDALAIRTEGHPQAAAPRAPTSAEAALRA